MPVTFDDIPDKVGLAPPAAAQIQAGGISFDDIPDKNLPGIDPLAAQSPIMAEHQNLNRGVVRGLQDVPEGGAQLAMHGLSGVFPSFDPATADVDKYIAQQEQNYNKGFPSGRAPSIDFGRGLGNMAASAPFAYLMPGAAAETLGGRMLSGAATGAVSGALQPADPTADFWKQKMEQAGIGAVGGAAAPALTGAAARVISPQTNPSAKLLMSEGVTPTVGQTLGGFANSVEEKLGSIPGLGDTINAARYRSVSSFNRAAINRTLDPIGESLDPKTPIGREAVTEMHDKISNAYDTILPHLTWQADPQFVQNVSSIARNANLTPDKAKQFSTLIQQQFAKANAGGVMPGELYKEVDSKIGLEARSYANAQDPDQRKYGQALQQVQTELRAALARSNPAYAPDLNNINAAYANSLRVQGAAGSQGANNGVFSPAQLSASVRSLDPSLKKGSFARGGALMQDLTDAGKDVLGNKVPDSGTAGRSLMALGAMGLAGTGAEHMPFSHFTLPAIGAGALGMGAYTQPGQWLLRALASSRPAIAGPLASGVRAVSPAASSALGPLFARQQFQ